METSLVPFSNCSPRSTDSKSENDRSYPHSLVRIPWQFTGRGRNAGSAEGSILARIDQPEVSHQAYGHQQFKAQVLGAYSTLEYSNCLCTVGSHLVSANSTVPLHCCASDCKESVYSMQD